ncbi:MAG: flagellar hook-associated protein FlgL [Gammaproteobacteria bacterium]|nr:flagellar hook-associated protein FlgL [Gammaproteobacteria bacterium]
MRISTAQVFSGGISAIQRQQGELANVQRQLATGRRILSPSDDPGGAVQALKLRERVAQLQQYDRNATLATNRLQLQETVLTQMGESLQRVRELTVQAANGAQTNESRAAIAREIRQLSEGLLDQANTRDASGEYVFAGYRSGNRPFVRDASGAVEYLGDGGQRRVALSPDRTVAVGDSGLSWMNIPFGNGVFRATPEETNAGTARVNVAEVTDPTAIVGTTLTLTFDTPESWTLTDPSGAAVATGSYTAEAAIEYAGRRIVLSGTPEAGDSFTLGPAGAGSLFEMVDRLATTLETPRNTAAGGALRDQAITAALEDMDQALGRVLELRTSVGARLNTIDSQLAVNDDQKLQLQTALSEVEDLDFAEAISRFNLQQVALQAAQQTYVQLGRLSLFDYLR